MRWVVAVLVLSAVACGSGAVGAEVACEQFVERRVGAAVDFDDDVVSEERGGGWYVRSRFDAGEGVTVYECEVVREGDGWRLLDLTTDR